jgi:CheY-like chemotaxis protein
VVTDIVMPGMNGPELVRRLVATKPNLRALYISGYTREALNGRTGLAPGTAFLQKPFTMGSLASTVRSVLDEPTLAA